MIKTKDNVKNWEAQELVFKPIDCSIDTNKINQLHINVQNDVYDVPSFTLNETQKNIYHPLNFQFVKNVNLQYKFEDTTNQENIFPTITSFKCDSISDSGSSLYHFRNSFLDKRLCEVKIDKQNNNENEDFNLGVKDPWAIM